MTGGEVVLICVVVMVTGGEFMLTIDEVMLT